jgi:hypothetical protein
VAVAAPKGDEAGIVVAPKPVGLAGWPKALLGGVEVDEPNALPAAGLAPNPDAPKAPPPPVLLDPKADDPNPPAVPAGFWPKAD